MALNYRIRLIDRANEANYHDFLKGADVNAVDIEQLRHGGCGAFSLTAHRDDWASVDALMATENLVEVSLDINVGSFGEHPDYTGIVTKVDKEKSTPPKRTVRTITAQGLKKELSRNGCLILAAYANQTIQAIVQDLITTHIAPYTDIIDDTSQVTTGADYTIVQAIYEDKPALDVLKKLAEINTATDFGVDAQRRVFFRPETASDAVSVVTLQLGDKDDGVASFKHEEGSPGPNAFIVAGRTAHSGNPMTVYRSDVEAGERTRTKRVRAPSNVTGADLVAWGDFLVAKHKAARVRAKIPAIGIESDGIAKYVINPNNNATVLDKDGAEIDQYQIQAVTYAMKGGGLDAAHELGDDPELDLLDTAGLRDLIREMRVFQAQELSNQVEVDADGTRWSALANIFFVGEYGMRNSVRLKLDDFKAIDAGDDETAIGEANNSRLMLDKDLGGISSTQGGPYAGRFVTKPIELGMANTEFSIYGRLQLHNLIKNNPGADLAKHFDQPETGHYTGHAWTHSTMTFAEHEGGIAPECPYSYFQAGTYGNYGCKYDGRIVLNKQVADHCIIKIRAKFAEWTHQGDEDVYTARAIWFRMQDRENYVQLGFRSLQIPPNWSFFLLRYVDSVASYGAGANLQINEDDIVTILIDNNYTYFDNFIAGFNVTNETTGESTSWKWSPDAFLPTGVNWHKIALHEWFDMSAGPAVDWVAHWSGWRILSIGYDAVKLDDVINIWQISRDGGESFEPDSAPYFDPVLGTKLTLGEYAGPGTDNHEAIIRGRLAYPQIWTHLGLGWK